jgi:hypothetical protein
MYNIVFRANVVTPAIHVRQDILDFGKVICGQRKTAYLRIENKQPVPAVWALQTLSGFAQDASKEDKAGEDRFTMFPISGKLRPG